MSMIQDGQGTGPGTGHNEPPDWAAITAADLAERFLAEFRLVPTLLEQAHALAAVKDITDDTHMGKYTDLMVRLKNHFDTLDSHREKEKAPHETRYNTVNTSFFGLMEKLKRRKKGDPAGAWDVLYAIVDNYQQAKLAREQQRRRQDALDARKDADQTQAEADIAAEAAAEALRVAARARAPQHIETKTNAAEQLASIAEVKRVDVLMAQDKAESAEVHALAKPADLVRTRSEGGSMAGMGTEPYAIIEDDALLDKTLLWPHISLDAKEKALRKWASLGGHKVQMAGARIGKKPKTLVRG